MRHAGGSHLGGAGALTMRMMICAAACMLLLAALYGRGQQMPLFFVLAPLAVYVSPVAYVLPLQAV